jgi:hypothetical protein
VKEKNLSGHLVQEKKENLANEGEKVEEETAAVPRRIVTVIVKGAAQKKPANRNSNNANEAIYLDDEDEEEEDGQDSDYDYDDKSPKTKNSNSRSKKRKL